MLIQLPCLFTRQREKLRCTHILPKWKRPDPHCFTYFTSITLAGLDMNIRNFCPHMKNLKQFTFLFKISIGFRCANICCCSRFISWQSFSQIKQIQTNSIKKTYQRVNCYATQHQNLGSKSCICLHFFQLALQIKKTGKTAPLCLFSYKTQSFLRWIYQKNNQVPRDEKCFFLIGDIR